MLPTYKRPQDSHLQLRSNELQPHVLLLHELLLHVLLLHELLLHELLLQSNKALDNQAGQVAMFTTLLATLDRLTFTTPQAIMDHIITGN